MKRSGSNGAMMSSKAHIPKGWRLVRLGDVLSLQYGVSLPERARQQGQVPVVGSAGIVGFHNQSTVKGPGIVVGRKGSIGSISWIGEDFVPIDTTYFVVPIDGQVDLRWAYYELSRESLSRLNRATGIPGLNRDDVFALERCIPPLPEQRAIAAVLDSIDDAIERAGAVIAATEQLRDSLLHQLLTRGVPGWHTEWKEAPGLGTIPAEWEVVRLGDILESTNYGTNAQLGRDGDVTVLRMNNLQNGEIDLSDVRRASLSEKEGRELNLVPGDILFNRTNSLVLVGKVAVVRSLPDRVSFASYLIRLRTVPTRANSFWLNALLWSSDCQSRIRKFATPGVSQANVNPTSLKSLAIPLPSLPEQEAIAGLLDGVDVAIGQAKHETNMLKLLKESTADALLTGRVRVEKA